MLPQLYFLSKAILPEVNAVRSQDHPNYALSLSIPSGRLFSIWLMLVDSCYGRLGLYELD
ncbi:aconitase family protein [Aspergillus luchuensis]|uniref:Aconitase family protein n=1 Tax=Aspergillus kawachii TaxID=1069201 RepID=A0A146F5F4_ASPKA|nr:aconitase family protein [Aspergillus luchuensis]